MFFLQAVMAPVPVRFKDRIYMVPKMIMDELIVWAVEVRDERLAQATVEMDPNEKRQHMSMYPPVEPDIKEMHMLCGTPSGIRKVIRTCMPKAEGKHFKTGEKVPPLTEQEVDELMKTNSAGRLHGLAWELIDIKDTSQINPYDDNSEVDGEHRDPIRRTEKVA